MMEWLCYSPTVMAAPNTGQLRTSAKTSACAIKRGAGGPATTYGELKKEAKADLVAGLEGKRKDKNGKPMTKKQAEEAADCLVKEADKQAKKQARAQGKKLNNNTKLPPPGGCFPAGTLVRLASGERIPVERLVIGDRLHTIDGALMVTRIDPCRHYLIELVVGGASVRVASY